MSDLVVIVPVRGRPQRAPELVAAFKETCTADTQLIFAIDEDDPTIDEYMSVLDVSMVGIVETPRNMVWALNCAAKVVATAFEPPPFAIGFMGDDHRPRTHGWDEAYLSALRELGTGLVYGNDLFQGERIPTQAAMTTDIVRALGYMAPPTLIHLFVDNYWLDLGHAAQCIRYLPDVVVEHMHPVAGKGEWDEGYARANAPMVYQMDQEAYTEFREEQFALDVAKVKGLRGAA